jgi:hypothetical protein
LQPHRTAAITAVINANALVACRAIFIPPR